MPARLKSAMSQYYAGLPGDYGRFRVVSQTYTRRTSRYEFMLSRVIVLILFYRFVGELSKRDTESESGMLINTCLFRLYRSKWNYYENKRDLHTLRGFLRACRGRNFNSRSIYGFGNSNREIYSLAVADLAEEIPRLTPKNSILLAEIKIRTNRSESSYFGNSSPRSE